MTKFRLFLLLVLVWNSSLLTGELICLSRKSLLLRLHNLHVYLACVKIKRNENTCIFSEQINTDKLISVVGNEFAAES